MKNYIRLLVYKINFLLLTLSIGIEACIVTVMNDGSKPILLVSEDNSQATIIQAHAKKNFGNENKHARFYVMKNSQGQFYDSCYFVGQHACTSDKQMLSFSLSDIEHNTVNHNFFKISQFNDQSLNSVRK